jgi:hypothetical protein
MSNCATCVIGATGILEYSGVRGSTFPILTGKDVTIGSSTIKTIDSYITYKANSKIPGDTIWTQKVILVSGPGNFVVGSTFHNGGGPPSPMSTIISYTPDVCVPQCPLPVGCEPPTADSCCPLQYERKGLVICYRKTKFNTAFSFKPGNCCKGWGRRGNLVPQTRIQGGRWNHSLSNTKLYPVISQSRDANGNITSIKQSKNLFRNTDYKMSKNELMSYLSRNRKYLNR